jgi:Fe-S cluster assembly protein SufD
MSAVSADSRPYLEAFDRFEREGSGNGRSGSANGRAWVAPLRRSAIDRFAARGFPSQREEGWRCTSVAPIARVPFTLAGPGREAGVTPKILERLTFEPWECSHLVFVNGRLSRSLSRLRELPEGVVVRSLEEALASERARVEPHLGRLAAAGGGLSPFPALNTAFLQDGAFLSVPPGTVLAEPIHLLFVSTAEGRPTVSHPRVLALFGERSEATLVESFVGLQGDPYFTNGLTEIVAEAGSAVDHYRLQRESETAFHVGGLEIEIGRNARVSSQAIALGGALVRNDVRVVLAAEGADCTLNGLAVSAGRQHIDSHTVIDHARPHGTSRELYKGVLDDSSRGVFDGVIIVRPDAQKTDARQENRNLLLSEDALVDSKPTLQILNDDVKCSHAATIGQLDEDSLFYLRSRGITEDAARSLLVHAFMSDIVGRIKVQPVRAGLDCLLFTRLPGHRTGSRAARGEEGA